MPAVLLLVILVVATAVALQVTYLRVLPRWEQRGIAVTARDLRRATTAAAAAGGLVGVLLNPLSGVLTTAWVAFAIVASVSDARCRLIPSGAAWASAAVGGVGLVVNTVLVGIVPAHLVTIVMLLVVCAAFLVLTLVGAMGAGDLRLLLVITATLWWVAPVFLLGALLLGMTASAVSTLVRRAGSAPLAPFLCIPVTVAVLLTLL